MANKENLDFKINQQNSSYNQTLPPNYQGGTADGKEQIDFTNFLQHANHPCICFFTIIFKLAAILTFLFLTLFINNDALIFIMVIVFSAFDFWFVKNVSGRVLVGLRWWNEVRDDGKEVWIFESDYEIRKTSIDSSVFWFCLYSTPIFWGVYFTLEIIGFRWMWCIVSFISLVLTGSNMLGYYKCSNEQKKKFTDFFSLKATEGFSHLIQSGMLNQNK